MVTHLSTPGRATDSSEKRFGDSLCQTGRAGSGAQGEADRLFTWMDEKK